ncbi:unnamed protein product [Caenorhabditis brenneri]
MGVSTPSKPTNQHNFVAPTGPKRFNRIKHLQREPEVLCKSPLRSENALHVTAALRSPICFPLRPLHHHFSASPSTKRSQIQNPDNRSKSVFYPANTEKLKLRNSNWDSARPVLSSRPTLYVEDHKFAEVLKSPIKYTPTNNAMRLFKDSEPMEIELGFDDFGSKYYYNDSMEIDIDDDNMEVDTTVDIESLMDFIPMN